MRSENPNRGGISEWRFTSVCANSASARCCPMTIVPNRAKRSTKLGASGRRLGANRQSINRDAYRRPGNLSRVRLRDCQGDTICVLTDVARSTDGLRCIVVSGTDRPRRSVLHDGAGEGGFGDVIWASGSVGYRRGFSPSPTVLALIASARSLRSRGVKPTTLPATLSRRSTAPTRIGRLDNRHRPRTPQHKNTTPQATP